MFGPHCAAHEAGGRPAVFTAFGSLPCRMPGDRQQLSGSTQVCQGLALGCVAELGLERDRS